MFTMLDIQGVAARAKLAKDTVASYHKDATARRKKGAERPGDMPAPDDTIGGRPAWHEATIDEWLKNRPGRGAGGGRPRSAPAAGGPPAKPAAERFSHLRIADELRRDIAGDPHMTYLPTGSSLMERFAVSRGVVTRAFRELAEEGLIVPVTGQPWKVVRRPKPDGG